MSQYCSFKRRVICICIFIISKQALYTHIKALWWIIDNLVLHENIYNIIICKFPFHLCQCIYAINSWWLCDFDHSKINKFQRVYTYYVLQDSHKQDIHETFNYISYEVIEYNFVIILTEIMFKWVANFHVNRIY